MRKAIGVVGTLAVWMGVGLLGSGAARAQEPDTMAIYRAIDAIAAAPEDSVRMMADIATHLALEADRPLLAGWAWVELGDRLAAAGRIRAAQRNYLRTDSLAAANQAPGLQALAMGAMARLFEEEGALDSAIARAEIVLRIAQQMHDAYHTSFAANHLARLYAKADNPRAEHRYAFLAFSASQAAPLALQAEMALDYANYFNYRGNNWDSAQYYYNHAYELFQSRQDQGGLARVLNNQARHYEAQRDYQHVLALYQNVLRLYRQANDSDGVALAYADIGSTHRQLNDRALALQYYLQAEAILEQRPLHPKFAEVCFAAADIMAEMGNHPQAFEYLRKYTRLRDSLMLSEHALALAEMETRFHSERQQRQIEDLEHRNQVDEERLHRQAVYLAGTFLALLLATGLAIVYNRLSRTRRKTTTQIRAQNSELQQAFEEIRAQNESLDKLNSELQDAYSQLDIQHKRKAHEIEEARTLVASMLPAHIPAPPGWALAVHLQAASEVGGDYYDYAPGPGGVFTLAVGDATGHSLHAAFIVATAKSHFIKYSPEKSSPDLLADISRGVSNLQLEDMYLALALLRLGPGGRVAFANAAMPPLLWYHHATGLAEWVEHFGFYLGSQYSGGYTEMILQAAPGDVLLLMSDGLAEAENPEGEMLGYERVLQWAPPHAAKGPQALINGLLAEAETWLRNTPFTDDATLMAITFRG